MTVVLKRVNNENMDEIKKIYEDSFPEEEMVPYNKLVEISNDTDHLFYGIYDDDALVGMNYLIVKTICFTFCIWQLVKHIKIKGTGKQLFMR